MGKVTEEEIYSDVLVVGSGLAGGITALEAAKQGLEVNDGRPNHLE